MQIQVENGIELKEVAIYNVQGQMLLEAKENLESLDLSGLSTVTYLIKLKTNQGEINQQLIKR